MILDRTIDSTCMLAWNSILACEIPSMNSATALMTSHNIVRFNIILACEILSKSESTVHQVRPPPIMCPPPFSVNPASNGPVVARDVIKVGGRMHG
jgi:hypothetical protein